METKSKLLSPKEAAEFLNISDVTLATWRKGEKNLPWVRIGSKVMYREMDLQNFIIANLEGNHGKGTTESTG